MKKLPLAGKKCAGLFTLIDEQDYEWLKTYPWWINEDGYVFTEECVATREGVPGRSARIRIRQKLHRFLMQPPGALVVDHINGDKLDNRRSNLRICTNKQNVWNQRTAKSSQRCKGVVRKSNKWCAYIGVDGKRLWLGSYSDKAGAVEAYDQAALKHFGAFAALNNPQR